VPLQAGQLALVRSPYEDELSRWFDMPISERVLEAMRGLARRRSRIETGILLSSLADVDAYSLGWERFWLHAGSPSQALLAATADPGAAGGNHSAPLDGLSVTISTAVLGAISEARRMAVAGPRTHPLQPAEL